MTPPISKRQCCCCSPRARRIDLPRAVNPALAVPRERDRACCPWQGAPGDQASGLHLRVPAGLHRDLDVPTNQAAQPDRRPGPSLDPGRPRHEIRVIQAWAFHGIAQAHLASTLLSCSAGAPRVTPIVPVQKALFALPHPCGSLFMQWIEAKAYPVDHETRPIPI